MPAQNITTPTRIPPQSQVQDPATCSSDSTIPENQIGWEVDTVPNDAYALQEQLNQLEKQFAYLRSQLRQAQKLASLGTTTAMIAHEFNNFFTPIVAYAQYALDNNDIELMRKALSKTLENSATMREMSDRIIDLARLPDDVIKAVKVKEVVYGAIGCIGRDLAKDNIELNIQIDADLSVRANENQFLQVMYNLIINARQAMMGRQGRLTIDAASSDDQIVTINVGDTGCGIAQEHLPYIFEAFFSTKQNSDHPEKKGLGLGLTICRDIIEDLGGKIEVISEKVTGTTFSIHLPQAD
ncbi:MAG: sensor histidine kinase [Planctomycetota bacterium]|jgi:signal transduction histidine kinase